MTTVQGEPRDDPPASPYRWVILGLGVLAYATSLFARQNYTGVQRFVAQDLHLDKAALGLLGSMFFYTYAFAQMPWGILADKLGSRWVTGAGILLTAVAMVAFASAESRTAVFFWRAASGVAGAAAFVSMTGGVAHWFPRRERGLSQATLGGVGGALGETTAFFLLPALAAYFAAGWRQSMVMIGCAIAVIGVLCLVGLRSAPTRRAVVPAVPFQWVLLRDPRLWVYTFLFSGFIVGLRGTQTWLVAYAADVLATGRGVSLSEAVVRGGWLVTVV
jgi:sugar phosphate permease